MNKYLYILILTLMQIQFGFAEGGNRIGKGNSDTLQALVINDNSAIIQSIQNLTGEEIFKLIDSLLDNKSIPGELIREINDYAESRFLEHDFYVSLTAYYDNSIYPAQTIYGDWNTETVYPFNEDIFKGDDTTTLLILEDTINFCNFQMPVEGPLTSPFGWREGKNHNGIDIDLQVWDPVVSSFDGMVRIAKNHGGYGRVVVVRHYNGLETLYAHLHRIKVKPGDIVEAGQIIGLGGSSGKSTGSHLHFEMRYKGKPLNPLNIIDYRDQKLFSDSLYLHKTKWNYAALPSGMKYHTVKRGDHLYGIAERYGTTIREICELNGIRRNTILRVGRKIKIRS